MSWGIRKHSRALAALALALLVLFPTPRVNAAPPHGSPETYTVQAGDTLYAIAMRYRTTVAVLKQMNGLGASDTILVGQKLIVPALEAAPALTPATTAVYLVQPGDTLYRIAMRHGVTMRDVQKVNDLPNPNLIAVGQALVIPKSVAQLKPGIVVDSPNARQGGTLLVQVAQAGLATGSLNVNGRTIPLARAAGFSYALVGVSRCAKLGSITFTLNGSQRSGALLSEKLTVGVTATAFPIESITLPPNKLSILSDQALIRRESDQVADLVSKFTPVRLWNGAFRQPVNGAITEHFGTRRSYNGGPVGACGHEGTDFRGPTGEPIYSDARGRVAFAGLTQVRGNLVIVDHGLGVFSGYYHLSEISVRAGQMVNSGELIGKIGSTGLSTGPHLHWSIWVNGEYVDPMEWTRRVLP